MQRVANYQEALNYLYRFIPNPQHRPDPSENLTRTRELLRVLGNPQSRFATVVIAGTKGKGSTTAMIAAMCRAAGLRTGMWTSPHLHSYRERIQVDGVLITQAALVDGVNQIAPHIHESDVAGGLPSTFAIGFALAMRHFADAQVDIAIVEVGLGGRYDSANVLDPVLSVITSVSYDHMEILGDTIVDIAMQKGGIAHAHVPVLMAPQPLSALVTLTACAAEAGAPCYVVDDPGQGGIRGDDPADEHVRGPIPELYDPFDYYQTGPRTPTLGGEFQAENARLAIAAALFLRPRWPQIDDHAIATGLMNVQWPGRYEVRTVGEVQVLFDGAHNPDSAERLTRSLADDFPGRTKTMVIGCSRDKDIHTMIPFLARSADQVIVTASRHPRAWSDLGALRDMVSAVRPDIQVIGIADPAEALVFAIHHARTEDLVVVTGSLFVVAAGREALGFASEVD
jgi:dihydrofolate synthase/folylpolyglutamate synthase